VVQGTHPSSSYGILPSCTSSSRSGDGSPSDSPRLTPRLVAFDACLSGLQSRDFNSPNLNSGESSLLPFADNSRTDLLDFVDHERDVRWQYSNPIPSSQNRDVASQLRKDRHPSSATIDRWSTTNVCWVCSIVNDSCEPGQAEQACQQCSVRSVRNRQ